MPQSLKAPKSSLKLCLPPHIIKNGTKNMMPEATIILKPKILAFSISIATLRPFTSFSSILTCKSEKTPSFLFLLVHISLISIETVPQNRPKSLLAPTCRWALVWAECQLPNMAYSDTLLSSCLILQFLGWPSIVLIHSHCEAVFLGISR